MNSHINLNHPENIYDDLKEKISDLIAKIVKNEQVLDTNLVGEKLNESKQILSFQQKEIERKIDELKRNSEWDYFTIAFFGETNAGKSTLIEVLRLLFAEKTKNEIQAKFKALKDEFSLDEEAYGELKNADNEISHKILENNKKLKEIDQTYTQKLEDYQKILNALKYEHDEQIVNQSLLNDQKLEIFNTQIVSLKEKVQYKKQNMSWWLKIIYIFKRLEEEKQIGLIELELIKQKALLDSELKVLKQKIEKEYALKQSHLATIQDEYELTKKPINSITLQLENEKKVVEQQLQQFEKMLEKLREFEDGQIMGDGRSDFTRESKEFLFDINGTQVKLIDVPGIEGDEKLVENEISKAVKKAHAVFYVTSKDAAPNEGTLQKIKMHLADQTEVWTVYNKPVTSPRSLKNGLISNDDERGALNDLNKQMESALDKHYKNYTVVAGLAAFYAVAHCLVPFGEKYRNQIKFLNNSDRDELKEKSGLSAFQNHLTQTVIGDVPYKIKASNFNKANYVLKQTVEKLNNIHNGFSDLKLNIDKQVAVTKQEIDSEYLDLVQSLKTMIEKIIQDFERKTRQEVYKRIESDISNDEFKGILKRQIDNNLELVSKDLIAGFKTETSQFDENLKEKLQKLSSRLASIQNNFKADDVTGLNNNVSLKFDINNGINKMGLLGVGIGVGAAMWWNPVGWVAISLTAAGLLFSFAKAIWSFFDSDFKKSEQKKSVDKNLSNIVKELKKVARENVSDVEEKIEPSISDLKKKLNEPSDQITGLVEDMYQSINMFKTLSNNISSAYEVK
ncbi:MULTISPECIES: GTPase [unclassified Acinetobacter]|uniref:GTPase n=1 Tax=unclassified Acinetobacter TaxID=196816 RepID=UPI0015D362B9|nr:MULTISPECIES: GTPase [unclassified Acinetobacter]